MLDLSRNRTWEAIDPPLPLKSAIKAEYRDELHLKRHYCVILYHEYICKVTYRKNGMQVLSLTQ